MLLIDDATIRTWHRLFEEDGVDGLAGFNYGGRACQLTLEQQEKLKVGDTLPTRMVGAWIEHAFEVVLREPFRADCAVASSGTGTSQGGSSTRPNSRPSSTPTRRC